MKEKILKVLAKNKDNKKYIIVKILLSLFLAITIVLDKIFVFGGRVFGTLKQNYFDTLEPKHIIFGIGVFLCIYIIITIIEIIVDKIEMVVYKKENRKTKKLKVFIIIFLIILLCWTPYILSFFPGGVYSDTGNSIEQVKGDIAYNNNHPILYTLILGLFINVAKDIQIGLELFTIFQVLTMAGICSYFVYWLYKKGISTKFLVLAIIFFGTYKLIPLYAVSIWKDTPYCIALFGFAIYIAEIIYNDAKNLEKAEGILLYLLLGILVSFLRNNGFYVFVGTTLIILISYRKEIFKGLKKFSILVIIEIIIIYLVQGPIYSKLKLNKIHFVESAGSLLQQVAYVVADDGNLSKEQIEFIQQIYPIDLLKRDYNPCIVDTIKWGGNFQNAFLEENKKEFLKVWFEVFFQNPKSYVKAYLLNTIGYWDINKSTEDAYVCPTMWPGNTYEQHDYIEKITNKSIRNKLNINSTISSAVFLFIMLLGILITIYKKRYKNLLIYLPGILTWLTIMIASPIAFSLRYVYILVLMVPLSLIIPFLKNYKEKEGK